MRRVFLSRTLYSIVLQLRYKFSTEQTRIFFSIVSARSFFPLITSHFYSPLSCSRFPSGEPNCTVFLFFFGGAKKGDEKREKSVEENTFHPFDTIAHSAAGIKKERVQPFSVGEIR